MNKHQKALLLSIFISLIYGIYPSFVKLSYQEGAKASAVIILTSFIRVLFFLLSLNKEQFGQIFAKKSRLISLKGGIFQFISTFSITLSLTYLSPPVMITVFFSYTFMFMIYLVLKKELQITLQLVLSLIAALFGISLVVGLWNQENHLTYQGILLVLLAGFVTFKRLYLFGKEVQKEDPNLVGARIFLVLFLFTPLSLFISDFGYLNYRSIIYIVIAGSSLGLASLLMLYAIRDLGSFRFSIVTKTEPVFTAIIAAIFLGDILDPSNYVGIFITVFSIAYYQYYEHKNRVPRID